jgi:hypothetical protein
MAVGVPLAGLLMSCAINLTPFPDTIRSGSSVMLGRVMTLLTGPTTRWYTPELRFFEVMNVSTHERFRVDVHSGDTWFVLQVPPGEYELSRLQISEGAFLGTAGLEPRFTIAEGQVTYVGTWRLGIESPQYDRSVLLSAIEEPQTAVNEALARYPTLHGRPVMTDLPKPSTVETRIYEVPPYPRFKWFRRHQTS